MKGKGQRLSIYLPDELADVVSAYADENNTSFSAVLQMCIVNKFGEHLPRSVEYRGHTYTLTENDGGSTKGR